jgi:hypothetical protein
VEVVPVPCHRVTNESIIAATFGLAIEKLKAGATGIADPSKIHLDGMGKNSL